MKGLKQVIFGVGIIMIGGFILIDQGSDLGGIGELVIMLVGIGFGIVGMRNKD